MCCHNPRRAAHVSTNNHTGVSGPGTARRRWRASACRGGDGQDYYGFDCECGSMDRRDEDLVEVDLKGLPPADNRDLEMDEYLLVGPL